MGKIVTFGEIMLRLAPNGYYRFFQDDQLQATFGGGEANVAVSLANFNEDVSFVTKLPNNPIADGCIRNLRSFNVDINCIVRGGDRIGIYYLEKGASQRGSVCVYDRKHSAFSEAAKEDFDWDVIFSDTEWFHITGITPALGCNLVEICIDACRKAKEKGIKISCDLNYRAKLWSKDEARTAMTKICKYVDVLIANEEDAENVFGIKANSTDVVLGKVDKDSYKTVAEKLYSLFNFEYVAFTFRESYSANDNGWSGMLYDGKTFYFSKEYVIHIVDRVGGGDSFGAGLIYSILHNKEKQDVIDFAVAASSLKQSIEGDYNRVSVEEVKKLANGDGSGRVQR